MQNARQLNGPSSKTNMILLHVYNKGSNHSAHSNSLISTFVICLLKSVMATNFKILAGLDSLAGLFIDALWSPAGKGLASWLSFVMSNCEFVTFPLVSWVRCGT